MKVQLLRNRLLSDDNHRFQLNSLVAAFTLLFSLSFAFNTLPNYVARAKLVELTMLITELKSFVQGYYGFKNTLPSNEQVAHFMLNESMVASSVHVDPHRSFYENGNYILAVYSPLDRQVVGLTLRPNIQHEGSIFKWDCEVSVVLVVNNGVHPSQPLSSVRSVKNEKLLQTICPDN